MRYEDMENENSRNILRTVEYDLSFPSRADVAKHLGLSRAAVTSQVNNLMALHLVSEDEAKSGPSRGRPASPLSIDTEYWQVIGASLHDFTWEIVITDLKGRILFTRALPVENFSPDTMISTLVTGLLETMENWQGHLLPGIGIGVPGVVDSENGDIVFAYDFNWTERINISGPVEEATGFRTYIMNRFMLEGVAEFRHANPEKIKDMIYIGVGSGIRCAIFNDGRLVQGTTFSAGRISHIQIDPNGERCTCGRIGCLFTFASEKAIVSAVRHLIDAGNPSTLKDETELSSIKIGRAADNGDVVAMKAMNRAGKAVAKALMTISDILNPYVIIVGGQTGSCRYFNDTVNREFTALQGANPYVATKVRQSRINLFESALGAATLVSENKLDLAVSVNG